MAAAQVEKVLTAPAHISPADGKGIAYTLPVGTVIILPPGMDLTPKQERTVWH